jgi:hypothetical protein
MYLSVWIPFTASYDLRGRYVAKDERLDEFWSK